MQVFNAQINQGYFDVLWENKTKKMVVYWYIQNGRVVY